MRVSDERRERTVAALRERALDGCLTLDTFAHRVEAAYRAKTEEELAELVADLPAAPARARARGPRFARLRDALSRLGRRRDPGPPAMEIEVLLPRSAGGLTVGRSQGCDVGGGEETVSRCHAELRHGDDEEWTIHDLGSTNGTWLNGSRVR